MRVLLIGATGFIGNELLHFLVQQEGVYIDAMVHKTLPQKKLNGVNYLKLSYTDIDVPLLQQGNYDYIFHLGRISVKKSGNIGRRYAGIKGRRANKKLLSNINSLDKKPKLIYLSGSLMYGDNGKQLVDEDTSLSPTGFAKYYYTAEQPFLEAIDNGATNIILLRAPWVLGLGSWFEQIYLQHIYKTKAIPAYGDEDRAMSIITVEDCAAMMWHYAQHSNKGGVYNIYTFQKIILKDLINLISNTTGIKDITNYTEQALRKMADNTTKASILCEVLLSTKHQDLLNTYTPLHPNLECYIANTIKNYEARKHNAVL